MRISDWSSDVCSSDLLGETAIVSSFGAESAVLLHLVSRAAPDMPVLFLDTGKHFPETLAYRDELAAKLNLNIVNLTPDAAELEATDATELRWSYAPEIGRASCRERVCQYVYISVDAGSLKNKTIHNIQSK